MTMYYSDPSREHDTYALPDVEVFWQEGSQYECHDCGKTWEPSVISTHKASCSCVWCLKRRNEAATCPACERLGEKREAGFYYWFCFPGCTPEGEPDGPYATEAEAIAACRELHCE